MSASSTLVRDRVHAEEVAAPAADSAGLLYERYYDRIYGYCLYQLGSREEAEDAAQTTFLWAFRGLRRGIVPRAEASWLFTIAQNACRARHRSRGRRRRREVVSDPVLLADVSPAPAASTEELIGLEDALARMPELQRRAILLREWRGLSYREIGEQLDLSGPAVETLIFRARRSLAELLAGRPSPKRARRYAFDFGSIVAALRPLFGAGSGAKLAAGLAVVVAATTLGGASERAPAPSPGPSPAPAPSGPAFLERQAPILEHHVRTTKTTSPKQSVQTRQEKPAEATPEPAESAAPVAPTVAPTVVPTVVESTVGTLDQAAGGAPTVSDVTNALPLKKATDTVDATLDSATSALVPVTAALPR